MTATDWWTSWCSTGRARATLARSSSSRCIGTDATAPTQQDRGDTARHEDHPDEHRGGHAAHGPVPTGPEGLEDQASTAVPDHPERREIPWPERRGAAMGQPQCDDATDDVPDGLVQEQGV